MIAEEYREEVEQTRVLLGDVGATPIACPWCGEHCHVLEDLANQIGEGASFATLSRKRWRTGTARQNWGKRRINEVSGSNWIDLKENHDDQSKGLSKSHGRSIYRLPGKIRTSLNGAAGHRGEQRFIICRYIGGRRSS